MPALPTIPPRNRPGNGRACPEPLHECGIACGIVYDPMCPVWTDRPAAALSADTVAQLLNTIRSPAYRRELRAVLLDLLADPIADMIEAGVEATRKEVV